MTIPTLYLWPLGCLCALGALHAGFLLENAILTIVRTLTKGVASWR